MVTQVSAFGLKLVAQQSLHWDLQSVSSKNYIIFVGWPDKGELPVQSHFCWKKDFLNTEVLWFLETDSVAEPRTCNGCSTTGSSYTRTHCASLLCLTPGFLPSSKNTDGLVLGMLI